MSGDPTGPADKAGREHASGRMSQGLELRKQHQCESTEDVSSHGFHLGWWPSVTAMESRKLDGLTFQTGLWPGMESRKLNGLMVSDRTMACSRSLCPAVGDCGCCESLCHQSPPICHSSHTSFLHKQDTHNVRSRSHRRYQNFPANIIHEFRRRFLG